MTLNDIFVLLEGVQFNKKTIKDFYEGKVVIPGVDKQKYFKDFENKSEEEKQETLQVVTIKYKDIITSVKNNEPQYKEEQILSILMRNLDLEKSLGIQQTYRIGNAIVVYLREKKRVREMNNNGNNPRIKKLFSDLENGNIEFETFEEKVNNLLGKMVKSTESIEKFKDEILWQNDDLLIAKPKTFESDVFWSKYLYPQGTSWCTARAKSYFNDYIKDAPLFIFIDKKNPKKRYQFFGLKYFAKDNENPNNNLQQQLEQGLDHFLPIQEAYHRYEFHDKENSRISSSILLDLLKDVPEDILLKIFDNDVVEKIITIKDEGKKRLPVKKVTKKDVVEVTAGNIDDLLKKINAEIKNHQRIKMSNNLPYVVSNKSIDEIFYNRGKQYTGPASMIDGEKQVSAYIYKDKIIFKQNGKNDVTLINKNHKWIPPEEIVTRVEKRVDSEGKLKKDFNNGKFKKIDEYDNGKYLIKGYKLFIDGRGEERGSLSQFVNQVIPSVNFGINKAIKGDYTRSEIPDGNYESSKRVINDLFTLFQTAEKNGKILYVNCIGSYKNYGAEKHNSKIFKIENNVLKITPAHNYIQMSNQNRMLYNVFAKSKNEYKKEDRFTQGKKIVLLEKNDTFSVYKKDENTLVIVFKNRTNINRGSNYVFQDIGRLYLRKSYRSNRIVLSPVVNSNVDQMNTWTIGKFKKENSKLFNEFLKLNSVKKFIRGMVVGKEGGIVKQEIQRMNEKRSRPIGLPTAKNIKEILTPTESFKDSVLYYLDKLI